MNDIRDGRKTMEFHPLAKKDNFMSEIWLLNAGKLERDVNLFDFYVESLAFRIKVLINLTLFY